MRVQSKITFAKLFLLEITFAELFLHLSEDDERVGERHVAKVTSADRGSSSGGGAEVDLTSPVALCEEFSVNQTRTNALEVLIRASRDRSYLPCMFLLLIFFGRSVHFFEDKSPSNNKLIWSGLSA